MKGIISFELENSLGHTIESVEVQNIIMDNVLQRMAGMGSGRFNSYRIAIGTQFNDDELRTNLTSLPGQIFLSDASNTKFIYNTGDKHFVVEAELSPLQGNGNLISIGIVADGVLYNRAILKRSGKIHDNETNSYKIVGLLGAQISPESDEVSVTTGASGDKNSIKVSWQTNGASDFYQVYRKSPGSPSYKLLTTTNKLFIYDDGYFSESSAQIPTPAGILSKVPSVSGTALDVPTPYSVIKTQDFAAKVRVKIQF